MTERTVIIGGTSGIGLATAQLLQKSDHEVIVTGRDRHKLDAALTELGSKTRAEQVDARDPSGTEELFTRLGRVDHVVITVVGARGLGGLRDLSLDELRRAAEDKWLAHATTAQAAARALRADGSLTFVTAATAGGAMPETSGIASVNGAVATMVPILAVELAPIRVNAVSPGVIDTPWWNWLHRESRQQNFAALAATTPAGRVGRAEDVAAAIGALIDNTFITGVVIPVDGGLRLRTAA